MRTQGLVVERFWNFEKKEIKRRNQKQPQRPLVKIPRAKTLFALSHSFRCVPNVCQKGGFALLSTRKLHNLDVNDLRCPLNS